MAIWLTLAPVLLVALHGKLSPLGSSGALDGLPYGVGVFRIICAPAMEENMAAAMNVAINEGMMTMNDFERYGLMLISTCEMCCEVYA